MIASYVMSHHTPHDQGDIDAFYVDEDAYLKLERKRRIARQEENEDRMVCCGEDDETDGLLTAEETIECCEHLFKRIGQFIMSVFPWLRRKVRKCHDTFCVNDDENDE